MLKWNCQLNYIVKNCTRFVLCFLMRLPEKKLITYMVWIYFYQITLLCNDNLDVCQPRKFDTSHTMSSFLPFSSLFSFFPPRNSLTSNVKAELFSRSSTEIAQRPVIPSSKYPGRHIHKSTTLSATTEFSHQLGGGRRCCSSSSK